MRTIAALVLLAALPSTAFAQLPTAGEAMGNAENQTEVARVTQYDFEADNVTGSPNKPLDEAIVGEDHRPTSSLIVVRQNFVPEMMKTVEDL